MVSGMERKRMYMIGSTHIDAVWLWEKAEGMQEVKSSFMSALERMKEFDDFIFTQSGIAYLAWMEENCPEVFAEIKERVAQGRWEITGGMWIEPDCDLPSGESLIRQFLYGKRFVAEHFGRDVVTAYNVDSFGHGANMPAICKGCGIKYYLMSRPDKKYVDVPPVFVWAAPDGSEVIAERTGGEYMAWTRPAIEWNLSESMEALDRSGYDRMAVFYGVGNHGGGPTVENIRTICALRKERQDVEMDFSRLDVFFGQVDRERLPVVSREMGRIFYGCYSSDCEIKTMNRRAEWALQKAEILACMAMGMGRRGYRYPREELDRAWKTVLFNQFHDILAGTSIEPARNAACRELGGAVAAAREAADRAVQAIANRIDTRGDGFPLLFVNPVGRAYEGILEANAYVPRAMKKRIRIRDFQGKEIPYAESEYENYAPESRKHILFEARVPAYGYALYRVITEGPDIDPDAGNCIAATESSMENGMIRVVFDEQTGAPCSISIKGTELLEKSCMFAVYEDDRGSWGEDVFDGQMCGSFRVTDRKVMEVNSMRAVVRYLLEYGHSEMMADYILEKNSDRLKIRLKLRNAEKQKLITLNVPAAVHNPVVYNETAFLAENKVCGESGNKEYYQHRFAKIKDGSGQKGLAVINDCTYGFHQEGPEYRLILLRNSSFARGGRGPLPDNLEGRFMNQGTYDYSLVIIPFQEPLSHGRLFAEADFLHMPVECLEDSCHRGDSWLYRDALLEVEGKGVHASGIKKASGDDAMILRFFETEGKAGEIRVKKGEHTFVWNPGAYEICTLRETDDGFQICSMMEE